MGSSMEWAFHAPSKVRFGAEAFAAISEAVGPRRALAVASPGFRTRGGAERLATALGDRFVGLLTDVPSNPDVESIVGLCRSAADLSFDVIVAIGGGSVLDAAKVLGVGRGRWGESAEAMREFFAAGGKLAAGDAGVPVITVPTTSGTGAEVTPFATVWDNQLHRKFSVDGPGLAPEIAIVDPRLTIGLPEEHTVSTGLDAISQALESLWNKRANPVTLAIATQSLVHSLDAFPRLMANLDDHEARWPMAVGSLLAGVAISQTRTGIAHSISYPLTAHFGVPHGLACSFTLPAILAFNIAHDDGRFRQLTGALGMPDGEALVRCMADTLELARVRERILAAVPSRDAVLALKGEMFTPGRADNNLVPIDSEIVERVLSESL